MDGHIASSSTSSADTVIAATPLGGSQTQIPLTAQESRDKRLARQQARFRDRGGIFVSQQRTALLDVLLGKKTLKQVTTRRSRSRSVSVSPLRRKSLGKGVEDKQQLDTSTGGQAEQDESVPGPSNVSLVSPKRKKVAPAPARKSRKKATVATDTVPDATTTTIAEGSEDDFVSKPKTTKKAPLKSRGTATAKMTKTTKGTGTAKGRGKGIAKPNDAEEEKDDEDDSRISTSKAKAKTTEPPPKAKSKSKALSKAKAVKANTRRSNIVTDQVPASEASDIELIVDADQDNVIPPSSPLAHRGIGNRKRRAVATKPKRYADLPEDDEVEDELNSHPGKKAKKAKTKASLAASSKQKQTSTSATTPNQSKPNKSTKKSILAPKTHAISLEDSELEPKSKQTRPALTPVPEESEPESEFRVPIHRERKRQDSAAQSAYDLALAISQSHKAAGDFVPASRKTSVVAEPEPESAPTAVTVVKGKGKRKEQVLDDKDIVDVANAANGKRRGKAHADPKRAKKDATIAAVVPNDDEAEIEELGKGRGKPKDETEAGRKTRSNGGQTKDSTQVKTTANPKVALESPSPVPSPRSNLKRRAVVEPEQDDDEVPAAASSSRARTRKKAKTGTVSGILDVTDEASAPVPNPTSPVEVKARGTGTTTRTSKSNSKDSGGQGGNVKAAIDNKNHMEQVKAKKRKRMADKGADEEEEEGEEVPVPKKKSKEEEDKSARPSKQKEKAISKSQLKTVSRKQKENPSSTAIETKATSEVGNTTASGPTSRKATRPPPKSKTRRGPPQSVLDRIKKSASTAMTCNADYDEPDELDLLS